MSSSVQKQYNLGNLKELCGEDKSFFEEMIITFISSTQVGVNQMIACLKNADWSELAEVAHKLASPCSHLEAEELRALLRKIEDISRANSTKEDLPLLVDSAVIVAKQIVTGMSEETGIKVQNENLKG